MLVRNMKKDDRVAGFYFIKNLEVKTSKGGEYFDLTLLDLRSNSIVGRLWNIKEADKLGYKVFDVICIAHGLVDMWEGKLQVIINSMRKSTEEDGYFPTDFIRKAPITPTELMNYIDGVAESIEHDVPRIIIQRILNRIRDKVAIYPAAMGHHHDYYSGLAYHMARMLNAGEFYCKQRPFLIKDYIKFGILGHDLGKVAEYAVEEQLGIATDMTKEGRLVGHIGIMHKWLVHEAISLGVDLSSDIFLHLEHLILSHHGRKEFGSPIVPHTPEAIALYYIDTVDAKLQVAEDAIADTPDTSEWSPRVKNLDYISILKTVDPNRKDV